MDDPVDVRTLRDAAALAAMIRFHFAGEILGGRTRGPLARAAAGISRTSASVTNAVAEEYRNAGRDAVVLILVRNGNPSPRSQATDSPIMGSNFSLVQRKKARPEDGRTRHFTKVKRDLATAARRRSR
jgi:hypothetical protein